jgi:hypothetical protein
MPTKKANPLWNSLLLHTDYVLGVLNALISPDLRQWRSCGCGRHITKVIGDIIFGYVIKH